MKIKLLFLFLIIFGMGYYILNPSILKDKHYLHGTVTEITDDTIDEVNMQQIQSVKILVNEKNYANKTISIRHVANLTYADHITLKKNDKIIFYTKDNTFEECTIYSYERDKYLIYLIILFFATILLISGKKGISSINSLTLTVVLIFSVFFPMVLKGINPMLASISICILATTITLLSIGGPGIKTYSAVIGTLGGTFFSIILTYSFGFIMNIKGIFDENADLINYSTTGYSLNLRDMLYAGIVIGALGAIMDVCMSISSAMDEICKANRKISNYDLFISGIQIGRDSIGTMSNTLILAYVGSSINLLVIFYMYNQSFIQLINGEEIASEILRALSGSIGLVLSIPITSFIYIMIRKK